MVLKAPDFPSVLVELGFLSNAHDVANLKSPEWREATAEAMSKAIDGFFGHTIRCARDHRQRPGVDRQAPTLVSPQLGSTRPETVVEGAPSR